MLMSKPRVLTTDSMIWSDNGDLALSHSMVKFSGDFF
jgi:hypothetical protein